MDIHVGVDNKCYNCRRNFGLGRSCQFCKQVEGCSQGVVISSAAKRFGGYLLEPLLAIVTLGIGWLIWYLIVSAHGQSPAKQVLGMRVVNVSTGHNAGFWRMVLREMLAKPIISVLSTLTLGIVNFWLIWDSDTQQLWDKLSTTIVVNDRRGLTTAHLEGGYVETAAMPTV